jgi:hypothetical protein
MDGQQQQRAWFEACMLGVAVYLPTHGTRFDSLAGVTRVSELLGVSFWYSNG